MRREGAGGRSGERGTKTWGGAARPGAGGCWSDWSAAGRRWCGLRGVRRRGRWRARGRGRGARAGCPRCQLRRPPLNTAPTPTSPRPRPAGASPPTYPERAAGARRSERAEKTMKVKSRSAENECEPSGHLGASCRRRCQWAPSAAESNRGRRARLMPLPRRPPACALRPPPPARPPPPPRGLRRRLLGASPPPRRSRRLPAALGGGRAEGPSRIILRGWEVLLSRRGAPSPTSPLSRPLSAFNTTIIISDSRGGGGRAGGAECACGRGGGGGEEG